jgi:hypothetical protein
VSRRVELREKSFRLVAFFKESDPISHFEGADPLDGEKRHRDEKKFGSVLLRARWARREMEVDPRWPLVATR